MINIVNCENKLTDEDITNSLKFLDEYVKTNSCCDEFPECQHPKSQTDPNVFESNDKRIKPIKESYLYSLKDVFKTDFDIIKSKTWAFIQKENKEYNWHNHLGDKIDEQHIPVSGIIYLNDLNFGTIFDLDNFVLEIKPKKFHWYIWPGHYIHTPTQFICNTNRYVIATSTYLRLKNNK
jgi:hypothetical protein